MTDKGFFLLDNDLNHPQIESIHKLISRAKLGNFVNAQIRIEGKYEYHEADWIKHLKRIPDSDKFTDEEICQGLDLQAKRITDLEQAIKRIVEAQDECKQSIPLSIYCAIADAAKMVEDV